MAKSRTQNTDSNALSPDMAEDRQEEEQNDWRSRLTIDRTMLPNKLYYLFSNGAATCVITFLPLQMKQIGLSPSMIGIASSVRPLISAATTAALCTLSDKVGYRRVFIAILLSLMMASGVLLTFIPNPGELSCDQIMWPNQTKDLRRSVRTSSQNDQDNLLFKRDLSLVQNLDNETKYLEHLRSNRSWEYKESGLQRTFILILVLGCLFEIFWRPSDALVDAATLVALKESDKGLNNYGSQRCWGNVAWDAGAFMAGMLLSVTRHQVIKCGVVLMNANYIIITIPYCVLMLGAIFNTYWLRSSHTTEKRPDWKNLRILLTPHHILILSTILFFGVCNGVVWGFLFWHLENLGATPALLGSAQILQLLSEIPAGYISIISIKRLGHTNSLIIGFLIYAARFLWLYWIKNPMWIILLEILQGFAFFQTWGVLVSYMTTYMPTNLFVTVCGLCNALYFSFGVSIGFLLTGFLIKLVGGSATFGYYGLANLVFTVLFAGLSRLVKEPKKIDEESDAYNLLQTKCAPNEDLGLLSTRPVESGKID